MNFKENELKPCPFCGSRAIMKGKAMPVTPLYCRYVVKCLNCGAKMESKKFEWTVSNGSLDLQECVDEWNALDEKWNRRAQE